MFVLRERLKHTSELKSASCVQMPAGCNALWHIQLWCNCNYLRQRSYVFVGVCLFAQKLPNRFSQNSVEKWHTNQGKTIRFWWQCGSRYIRV